MARKEEEIEPLNDKEREFATENHNLIYWKLRKLGLPDNDFYDVAAIGYIKAVKKYLNDEELRTKCTFSKFADRYMSAHLFRLKELEDKKKKYGLGSDDILSLDYNYNADEYEEDEPFSAIVPKDENMIDDLISDLAVKEVLEKIKKRFSKRTYETILLRMEGYSFKEIGAMEGSTHQAASYRISRSRKDFEIYRKYLE